MLELLGEVAAANPEDIENCIAGGMLRRQHSTIEFRHELARLAVLESLAASERLATASAGARRPYLSGPGRPAVAELARHAVGACDADAVLVLSPRAGRKPPVRAHKASLAHYDNALKYAGRLAPAAKAPLLAAHAHECWLTDRATRAVASKKEAIANYREAADPAEEDGPWATSPNTSGGTAKTTALTRLRTEPSPYWSRPGPMPTWPTLTLGWRRFL